MSKPRFYLTKRSNGIYYVGYREGERLRWKTTKCEKKSDAISFLSSFKIEEVDAGGVPLLSELWQRYASAQIQHLRSSTLRCYETAVKSFVSVCGDKTIDKYNLQDVENFKHFHSSRGAKASYVNIFYRSVKVVFGFGVRLEYIPESPFSNSAQLKVPQRLPAYLTSEELQKLFTLVRESVLRDVFLFGALTGLRLNEISNLRWSNMDLRKRSITLNNSDSFTTKSGKIRNVPMHDEVLKMMERLQTQRTTGFDYVFCKRSGHKLTNTFISHRFKKYIRLAGLGEDLHFHSLRHTCASHLVSAGVSLYSVQTLLGHANASTTMIYSHLSQSSLQDSINKIAI